MPADCESAKSSHAHSDEVARLLEDSQTPLARILAGYSSMCSQQSSSHALKNSSNPINSCPIIKDVLPRWPLVEQASTEISCLLADARKSLEEILPRGYQPISAIRLPDLHLTRETPRRTPRRQSQRLFSANSQEVSESLMGYSPNMGVCGDSMASSDSELSSSQDSCSAEDEDGDDEYGYSFVTTDEVRLLPKAVGITSKDEKMSILPPNLDGAPPLCPNSINSKAPPMLLLIGDGLCDSNTQNPAINDVNMSSSAHPISGEALYSIDPPDGFSRSIRPSRALSTAVNSSGMGVTPLITNCSSTG
ncbi:unnamed protein product, partial [Protopolystoma xenopodis]